jgi:cellulose synthase/poly-beta-1,6-N-acetylglucosamine synthase-like glycosyltransferase
VTAGFWLALGLLFYIYAGYPALVWMWAAIRPRPVIRSAIAPPITVVIVAHNEARRIAARLQNLLALDYPRDRCEIVVASDGSTDDTVARARAFEDRGIVVHAFSRRRGKPAVLNEVLPCVRGEIVVLGDARQSFDRGALRALVQPFADPRVGAVGGELVLTADDESGNASGVGFYWRYEKAIRRSESAIDSTVGATGAIYAIRRALFRPIAEDTVLDDVLIPMTIARRGYRVVFESAARACDRAAATAREEFARKVRTIAGNFQLFAREPWLLSPAHNRLWFQTVSHKGARLTAPLLHAVALAANAALAADPRYRALLALHLTFYLAALGGHALRHARTRSRLLSVPYAICLLSCATAVAFVRVVGGGQRVTWERASA